MLFFRKLLKPLLSFTILVAFISNSYAQEWQLESPNGTLLLSLRYQNQHGLQYRVLKDQTLLVVDWSNLGLSLSWPDATAAQGRKNAHFNKGLTFLARADQDINDSYTLKHGKSRLNSYSAKESRFLFQDKKTAKQLRLDIQLADDGLAFRYALPETSGLSHWIQDEVSEFKLVDPTTIWAQNFEQDINGRISYQAPFAQHLPEPAAAENKEKHLAMPALIETKQNTWVFIHESNLNEQYHGSHLRINDQATISLRPPTTRSADSLGTDYAVSTLPAVLPWRFVLITDDLANIVESNRVFDLAEPSKIENPDWVQPGLASWSWWSDHKSTRQVRKLRRFIDYGAQMTWPYSLIDTGWQRLDDKAVQDLVQYASKRQVGLGFWYHSGGTGSVVSTDVPFIMNKPQARKAEFNRLQELGVRYVKIDLFDGDKQIMIQQYLDLLKDAAAHQLMVIFHGSTVPRGWARTYPNLMSMEAVRSNKYYLTKSESDYASSAISQNSILPFTRNVIGSMDYAPIVFSNDQDEYSSSKAHEAALGVLFESGLQHLADKPSSYRKSSSAYQSYLRELPNAWEQTHFLSGYPGKDVVMARRAANTWYIAGINGELSIKQLEFSLDFLTSSYHRDLAKSAILISDSNKPSKFNSRNFELGAATKLRIKVAPAGGFVMIIKLDQDAEPAR